MKIKSLLVAAVLATTLLVASASAQAADICVGVSPLCPVEDHPASAAGITAALTEAVATSGPSVVHLAAGDYAIETSTFNVYGLDNHDGRIDILGQGPGLTRLAGVPGAPAGWETLITLWLPTADSVFSGFTLDVTQHDAAQTIGISLGRGTVSDFEINQDGYLASGTFYLVETRTAEGLIEHGSITTKGSPATGMIIRESAGAADVTVRDVVFDGGGAGAEGMLAVLMSATNDSVARLERITTRSYSQAVQQQRGRLLLSDSVIDLGADWWHRGLLINAGSWAAEPTSTEFTGLRNTFLGSADKQQAVVPYRGEPDVVALKLRLLDNVFANSDPASIPLYCSPSSEPLDLLEVQNWVAAGDSSSCDGQFSASSTEAIALDLAWFVDAAAGDWRPLASSPLVDAGTSTAELTPGALDHAGQPRLSGPAVDIGAFEYQHPAPEPPDDSGSSGPLPGTQTKKATAKLTSKPKKAFKQGRKSFSVMKTPKTKKARQKAKQTASFSVRFAQTVRAKFVLQVKKGKKFKAVKGTQTLKVKNGTLKLTFGGGWAKKKLKAGTYRLRLTPLGADGAAGKTLVVTLKVR